MSEGQNEAPVDESILDNVIIDDHITWGDDTAGGGADSAAHRGEARSTAIGSGRRRPYRAASEFYVPTGSDVPAGDDSAAARADRQGHRLRQPRRPPSPPGDSFLGTPPGNTRTGAPDRSVVLREPWRFDDKWSVKPSTHIVGEAVKRRGKHGGMVIDPDAITPDAKRHPKLLTQRAAELGLPLTEYDTSLSMAIRRMDGGREMFLRFVCLAAADQDDDAIKFLTTLRELKPFEQRGCSFDLVCLASGVSPVALLKTIVGVAFESHVDTGNLIAAAAHPQIVETAIRSAKRVNSDIGARDRQALLTHHGFLPTAKGATINVHASATAQSAATATTSADATVPKFLSAANVASAARETVQRQLSEGPMSAVIDAVPADVDAATDPVYEEPSR